MGYQSGACQSVLCILKRTCSTRLVNLLRPEDVLEDLEVGNELVLMFGIHIDPLHLNIAYKHNHASQTAARLDRTLKAGTHRR